MKKNFLIPAAFLCLVTSCNKSVDKKVGNSIGLVKIQAIYLDPVGDSMTTNYLYDDEDYLIKEWEVDFHTFDGTVSYPIDIVEYTRNEEKRVIKKTHVVEQDTIEIMNVHYNNADEIAYVIRYVARGTLISIDSLTYEYSSSSVKRINTFPLQTVTSEQPSYYETFEYTEPNVSQILSFYLNDDGTYQEGDRRDYEYDDKINPFFKHDDSFFNLFANNVIKETITYGIPQPEPKGYITTEYTYGSDNRPISSESLSTGNQLPFVTKTLYIYK